MAAPLPAPRAAHKDSVLTAASLPPSRARCLHSGSHPHLKLPPNSPRPSLNSTWYPPCSPPPTASVTMRPLLKRPGASHILQINSRVHAQPCCRPTPTPRWASGPRIQAPALHPQFPASSSQVRAPRTQVSTARSPRRLPGCWYSAVSAQSPHFITSWLPSNSSAPDARLALCSAVTESRDRAEQSRSVNSGDV